MIEAKNLRKLPQKSLILPELIPMLIPDFHKHFSKVLPNVLSFQKLESEIWFNEFIDLVESKIGKEYFPIMRMSDGEYTFLLGPIYPYFRWSFNVAFIKNILNVLKLKTFNKSKFNAATLPNVSSGNYTITEITQQKKQISDQIRFLSEKGVLALHLTYSIKPFQEHFHKKLACWFTDNRINLNKNNYYPFYFVYAMLRGNQRGRILLNKKILIFHSAEGNKKDNIINSLYNDGVSDVIWHQISPNRSMFDTIVLDNRYFEAEIAFVGAGVGKFNILSQIAQLNIPCIDVGFVFEVWADDNNKWKRPMMVNDTEWKDEKIQF